MQAPKNKIFYFRLNGKYNSFFTETFNSCLHNSGMTDSLAILHQGREKRIEP